MRKGEVCVKKVNLNHRLIQIYFIAVILPFLVFFGMIGVLSQSTMGQLEKEVTDFYQNASGTSQSFQELIIVELDHLEAGKTADFEERARELAELPLNELTLRVGDGNYYFQFSKVPFKVHSLGLTGSFILADGTPVEYSLNFASVIQRRMIEEARSVTLRNGAVILLAYFALNLFFFYKIARIMRGSFNEMKGAAKKIQAGNLEFDFPESSVDEVEEMYQSFDEMRLQLKESREIQQQYEQNRKELIANISHDLKTPLTSINGYVQGILDGVADTEEKQERYLHVIAGNAKEMEHLIEDLFLISKLDIDQLPMGTDPIDMVPYLQDCVLDWQFILQREKMSISLETELNHAQIIGDREQLKRVINNIVNNSVKHLQASGSIKIELKKEDGGFVVAIQDTGVGIAQDKLGHVFDKFYRTDAERNRRIAGSGLGLAISKEIIQRMGGIIWADSQLGNGTTISFYLPEQEEKK
jgi:signal transduction histidine kinase